MLAGLYGVQVRIVKEFLCSMQRTPKLSKAGAVDAHRTAPRRISTFCDIRCLKYCTWICQSLASTHTLKLRDLSLHYEGRLKRNTN